MNKQKTEAGTEPDVGCVGNKTWSTLASNGRLRIKQVLCSASAVLSGLFNFWSWHITHCWNDTLNELECSVENTNKAKSSALGHESLVVKNKKNKKVISLSGRIFKLVWMLWTCEHAMSSEKLETVFFKAICQELR